MFAKNKQKFKREDFIYQNGWFQTKVKQPGTLHMQQFQISDCEQCQIYILDSSAGVFIDDCKYCTIFVGPSQSSIFVRDCHYVNIVCMTQQFRVRDSTHCRFWLWCQSQPIIQSSHHLIFSCFPNTLGYELLLSQMKQAKLKLWNNNWFDIYDFTPHKYSMQNYEIVDNFSAAQKQCLTKIQKKLYQNKLETKKQMIPFCLGMRHCITNGMNSYVVIVLFPIPQFGIGLPVLHSRISKYPKLQLTNITQTGISEKYVDTLCLFIKIKAQQLQKWKKLSPQSLNMITLISDNRNKQILQSTVFVPFADQRS